MARPEVSATALEIYENLGSGFTSLDEDNDWALLLWIEDSTVAQAGVDEITKATDEEPGWTVLFDVDRCPVQFLPYLGQYVGVHFIDLLTEEEMRDRIRNQEGQRRGSPGALVAAIQRTLTGGQIVNLLERYGSAYHFRVETYSPQTPDEAATEAALLRQKPGGLTYELFVWVVSTFDIFEEHHPGYTFDDVEAEYPTFDDRTFWLPI